MPNLSSYEVKLLVCGLSRTFFGKPNSVYIPVETTPISPVASNDFLPKLSVRSRQTEELEPVLPRPTKKESDIGLPFVNQHKLHETLHEIAKKLCLALYWLKFNEDRKVYFNREDMSSRIARALKKGEASKSAELVSDSEDSNESSDSDDSDDDLGSLTDFLLDFYKGLTPQIFDKKTHNLIDRHSKLVCGTPADKFYSRMVCSLD